MQRITFENKNGDSITLKDTFPYLLQNLKGIGAADVTPLVQRGFQQDGLTHFGNLLEYRTISFAVVIQDATRSELLKKREEIFRVFNPKLANGKLCYFNGNEDGTEYSIKCSVVEGPVEVISQGMRNANMQAFEIAMMCPNPAWEIEHETIKMERFSGGVQFFDVEHDWPTLKENWESPEEEQAYFEFIDKAFTLGEGRFALTLGEQKDYLELDYKGNLESSIVVEFRGPITTPRITKKETGEYIEVAIELLEGEKLFIDTRQDAINVYKEDLNGTTGNAYNYINPYSSYFILSPGTNTLYFTTEAGDPNAYIHYNEQFVGV